MQICNAFSHCCTVSWLLFYFFCLLSFNFLVFWYMFFCVSTLVIWENHLKFKFVWSHRDLTTSVLRILRLKAWAKTPRQFVYFIGIFFLLFCCIVFVLFFVFNFVSLIRVSLYSFGPCPVTCSLYQAELQLRDVPWICLLSAGIKGLSHQCPADSYVSFGSVILDYA